MPRGQQRQLVERQRPARRLGRDEGDPPDAPVREVVEQGPHGRGAPRPRERQRIVERRQRPCSRRQHQRVLVGQRVAGMEHDASSASVDSRHAAPHKCGAEVLGDPLQRIPAGLAEPKWLEDRHRLIDKVRLRRHERRPNAIAGQVAQRHHRLEGGDATANDQHSSRRHKLGHEPKLRPSRPQVNRA
jgi:hypothetical protein